MAAKIPILDMTPEIEGLWPELEAAMKTVLRHGQFIMGPEVARFEKEIAAYLGVVHAVGLNSGTDALVIGLRALGVKPGDEVITTAFSFFATAEAISHLGAVPVFADINPATLNVDPEAVERVVTSRTRAIIPVHLFGQGADMDAIMAIAERHGLRVLEDVAQAFSGSFGDKKLGTIGHAGAFSFFPSKNLGAFGDGGLLATNDALLADHARRLRAHGGKNKYFNEEIGYNSRLDTIQAAILAVKLPYIEAWSEARRKVAARYDAALRELPGISVPRTLEKSRHVYHQYTIRIGGGGRDAFREALAQFGVETMIYYPVPIHRLPVYAGMSYPALPHTEAAAEEVVSLPIGPLLTEATQDRVIEAVVSWARSTRRGC